MKKKSSFSTKGKREDIGDLNIQRILPNRYADAVGPFVFLDHLLPVQPAKPNIEGTGAHPHRGIATLTYMLEGEAQHFDSAGNSATVHSGGIQWMNAGNGIIHDETVNADSKTGTGKVHAFQFWINLPAKIKAAKPRYMSIEGGDVPIKHFENGLGYIKVIVGAFDNFVSQIPDYSHQFLYHIHLEPGGIFNMEVAEQTEMAAYLPGSPLFINDEIFEAGDFVEYDRKAGEIEVKNTGQEAADILLFGGEPYVEPIVAEGPFVMNTMQEIGEAYKDYYGGKYGKIDYSLR